MQEQQPARTNVSLLGRLRLDGSNAADWAEFTQNYGSMILQWGRRWGLQEADAQDVSQDVLVRLAARMRSFEYDPTKRFRAYVKTLAHFTWCDLIESRKRTGAGGSGDTVVLDRLNAIEARDDLQARMSDAFDQELLQAASARVQLRVEPKTWEAFRLTAIEGLSGAEVATRVEMNVATVFKAKSKVQKMLREEIARLEEED